MHFKLKICFYTTGMLLIHFFAKGQISDQKEPTNNYSLEQCISYALKNQPAIQQAKIDEEIGEKDIKIGLSGWYPQISAQYNYQNNILLPTMVLPNQENPGAPGNPIRVGLRNNSNFILQASQTLFSPENMLASKTVNVTRLQYNQNLENIKINTVVEVSKAFYDVLLTQEQLAILKENVARLEKQYNDAFSQYESGLVDKTDYQRAGIALANTKSDLQRAREFLKAKGAYLKQLMGFPQEDDLEIEFDKMELTKETKLETSHEMRPQNRIEFQQLQTEKQRLGLSTSFHKWSFLPVFSAFYNYNWVYLNNDFSNLYNEVFPTSVAGVSLAIPLFQGTRRLQNLQKAQLQEKKVEIEQENIKRVIHSEHETALASYKSNYNDWITLKENVSVAEEVYNIIKLQYDEGIKTYLELIVAETELRTTQINYFNALYRVMASKLDYQRALGIIEIK